MKIILLKYYELSQSKKKGKKNDQIYGNKGENLSK